MQIDARPAKKIRNLPSFAIFKMAFLGYISVGDYNWLALKGIVGGPTDAFRTSGDSIDTLARSVLISGCHRDSRRSSQKHRQGGFHFHAGHTNALTSWASLQASVRVGVSHRPAPAEAREKCLPRSRPRDCRLAPVEFHLRA